MLVSTSSSAGDNRYFIVHEYSDLNSQVTVGIQKNCRLSGILSHAALTWDYRQTHGLRVWVAVWPHAGARRFSLHQRLSERRGSKAALLLDHHSSGSGVSPSGIPVRLGASLRPRMSYSTQTDLNEINVEPAIVRKYGNRYSVKYYI
jgi:hypothetical protein